VSGRRLALLVATYRYQDAGLRQLTAPGQDAEALAEVLRNPHIADFDVTILINEPHYVVGDAIGEFYHNLRRDDLALLYFTGHGLKDDQGRLYLAMTNTKRDRLLFTGLSAQQIDEAMESCWSRQKVLVLDCCYSGAFPAGQISKADSQVHTLDKFQGKGRVVLTASDATQYSFEGSHIIGQGTGSVFTRFLVEGLVTGDADLDGDGNISLDELYSYVYDRVVEEMPQQRPKKQENVEGRIVIARNIHWRLPDYVRNAIESPFPRDRLAVFDVLTHLHRVGNDLVRAEVINQTLRLIHDDSKMVSAAAMKLIMAFSPEMTLGIAQQRAQEETQQPLRRDNQMSRWGPAISLEVLMALEGMAASLAAVRATEDEIDAIAKLSKEHLAAHSDINKLISTDEVFHDAIVCASHNPLLIETYRNLISELAQWRRRTLARYWVPARSGVEHDNVVNFLKRGDSAGARAAMMTHLLCVYHEHQMAGGQDVMEHPADLTTFVGIEDEPEWDHR